MIASADSTDFWRLRRSGEPRGIPMNSWKIGDVNPKRSTKNMDHLDHFTVKGWHWKSAALEAEFAIGTGI